MPKGILLQMKKDRLPNIQIFKKQKRQHFTKLNTQDQNSYTWTTQKRWLTKLIMNRKQPLVHMTSFSSCWHIRFLYMLIKKINLRHRWPSNSCFFKPFLVKKYLTKVSTFRNTDTWLVDDCWLKCPVKIW